MLDFFTILTKGGIVLWSKTFARVTNFPLDALIKEVLIEERAGANNYVKESYNIKWTFANELDLIFVVAYQKILQLAYIEELLATIKKFFCDKFIEFIRDTTKLHKYAFDDDFDSILSRVEEKDAKEQSKRSKPRKFEETKKFKDTVEGNKKLSASDISKPPINPTISEEEIARNIEAIRGGKSNRDRGGRNKKLGSTRQVHAPPNGDFSEYKPKKKVMRVWDDKVTKEEMENLDYSGQGENIDMSSTAIHQNLEITEEDLTLVLANMKEHLIKKNVAADIATHLCDSVSRTLVGQKIGNFKSIRSIVKQSMESALRRILTPKTSVDLLRDILQAKSESRKSTNLSKTCFWLLQNGFKVLIAGCDTFRSGAVEQLKVHVRNLNALGQNSVVELYERGYGKDAAGIAKDAINFAKANGFDVVLIDTAGRMQDNEPLMRALAKLVTVNNPDKIIFVGEALVGNEAVDQLTKFNQALKDFSGLQNPRHIDGIILTKFDTIDDKVGAALSMAYTTGQPILFVGTGQTYTDLKNMRVGHIVQALLKE
ncbi:9656_t:CDS:10, partial [Dentiscutata erythropus]